jgi:hypothetical protein
VTGARSALVLACAIAAADASSVATPRIASDDLTIFVSVEREDGTPVGGLTAADFEVLVAGVRMPVQRASPGPRPLRIVLLVDVTTRPQISERDMERLVGDFVSALEPVDRARIGRVGRGVALGPPLANDAKALLRSARAVIEPRAEERSGPSPIWDALVEAAASLSSEDGRRAILLVTDGRATGNRHGLADVADLLAAANVSVSVIAPRSPTIVPSESALVRVHPERMPQALAEFTGGRFVPVDPFFRMQGGSGDTMVLQLGRAPEGTLDFQSGRTVASLRHEYAVTVARPSGPEARMIEVRVNRPGLRMRARRAYVPERGLQDARGLSPLKKDH